MLLPRVRDLELKNYKISRNKYRELKYFCMQYREKKERLNSICEISAVTYSGMPSGSGTGDRTAKQAESRVQLQNDLELIEQTAIETDSILYQYLISNVTDGIGYDYLDIPASHSTFYRIRQKFFYLLSQKK